MDADTTAVSSPSTPAVIQPTTTRLISPSNTMARRTLTLVGLVVVVIASFWGGRAYQNNIDQKLFNDYNPPTTGTGRAGFGGGGGGFGAAGASTGSGFSGQSSLVRAALGAGTPPGSSSGSSSTGAGSSVAGTAAIGGRAVGSIASITASSLSLQSFQGGTQTLKLTPATRFYTTRTGSIGDIGLGDDVTVAATPSGNALSAVTITLGPAGLGGGGGRFGAAGATTVQTVTGKVSSVTANSLTVTGNSKQIALTGSTRISKLVSARPAQFKSGSFVTATLGSGQGAQTAIAVVERSSFRGGGGFGSGGSSGNGS